MAMKAGAMLVEHARGVVDPRRRRAASRRTRWAGCWSTASARCRTRSWSTAAAGASPTRPPTTTRSAAAFHVEDVSRFEYANLPCWLVFDQTYVDTYGFRVSAGGGGSEVPAWIPQRRHARRAGRGAGHRRRRAGARRSSGGTRNCADGHDPDFGRGDSAFDCWWGDPHRKGRRDATLGPLDDRARTTRSRSTAARSAPRAARGSTPTAGSLDLDGDPIPGLYAAGNVMGSPFGMTYGGPGGTLGPAMVFGYLAGRHAASR